MSRWQSSGTVEGRDCSRILLARGWLWCCTSAKASAIASLSWQCRWCNRLCLYLVVSTRFHLHPVDKKARAQLRKIALISNFVFLWTLLLNASCVRHWLFSLSSPAPSQSCSSLSLPTTVNNQASSTVFHINSESPQTFAPTQGVASKRRRNEPEKHVAKHEHRARQNTNLAPKSSHRQSHSTNQTWPPLPFSRCTHH